MTFYCTPNVNGRPNGTAYIPLCANEYFDLGYNSHIRGEGFGLYRGSIFPGTAQLGNESGFNGPTWTVDADRMDLVELKRRYNVPNTDYRVYVRR